MNINFIIDSKNKIVISCESDLTAFSEVSVWLINENNVVCKLGNDILLEILSSLNNILLRVIKEEHAFYEPDSVGYNWNKWIYSLPEEPEEGEEEVDVYSDYWIWSTKKTGTWLYKYDEKDIVLEISPIYRWHFEEPENNLDYVSFKEFINDYKVILRKKIDFKIAKDWQAECQRYMELIKK
ncbi:hypothetical protein HOO54_06465 [Bacillus sp. WMMC1349]|uniref:hypothetical protein n=1 Tax=Bacillus sp. WMMC1349 TaxID=2736254 RepID=UPI001555C3AE|nr:hypothetical protein [Bacillus sp. WMMC1349]NPC91884.1 hypothetical protein [Bacillus sp. WMMC1349]